MSRSMRTWRVRSRAGVVLAAVLALTATVVPVGAATAAGAPPACVAPAGAPLQVTGDCVDPLYSQPVIDSRGDETAPVAHHRVSGHFEGTPIEFTIYLPPADRWEGRFFQWTYPIAFTPEQDTSRATDRAIGFALSSGGYAVQAGNVGVSLGYRHTAAAATFARTVAAEYYGTDQHIYGYLYGGSGGSYQTIGAAENTTGVWDGYVPYIVGTPMSNPYTFLIRAFARLLLEDEAEQIRDAVSPGGSGDPYAGLDEAEAAMLRELVSFGVPLAAWQNPSYLLMQDPAFFGDGGLGFGAHHPSPGRELRRGLLERPGLPGHRGLPARRRRACRAGGGWRHAGQPLGHRGARPTTATSSRPRRRGTWASTSSARRTAPRCTRSAPRCGVR